MQPTTSAEIRRSITEMQARKGELSAECVYAIEATKRARDGLINGTATPGDLASAESLEAAIRSALLELESHLRQAQTNLDSTLQQEKREESIERILLLDQQSEKALADFEACFISLCSSLDEHITTMLAANESIVNAKEELVSYVVADEGLCEDAKSRGAVFRALSMFGRKPKGLKSVEAKRVIESRDGYSPDWSLPHCLTVWDLIQGAIANQKNAKHQKEIEAIRARYPLKPDTQAITNRLSKSEFYETLGVVAND